MRNSRRVKAILASASVLVIYGAASAATETWTGLVPANTSNPTLTYPTTTAQWITSNNPLFSNWANASGPTSYTAGDSVIFTDNFAGLSQIALSGNLNSASMEFAHAGSTPTTYEFLSTNALLNAGFTGTSSAPWATTTVPPVLTLDPGFLGKVILEGRPTSLADGGQTNILGGTLEIDDGAALPPFTSGSNPSVTINNGTLEINVNTTKDSSSGNTSPASSQLAGTMNVTGNSTMALGANNSSRMWNGTINISPATTLFFNSLVASTNEMDLAARINGTGTISLGTTNSILRLDSTNTGSITTTYDTGTGAGIIRNDIATGGTMNLGALTGGPNTFLDGSEASSAATTYSIGQFASSTFQGIIRDNGAQITGIAKAGNTTLTLTNNNTYTNTTTTNQGVLLGTVAGGTPFGTGNIAINGGVLSYAPTGSGSAITDTGASATATTQLSYGGGGTLSISKGAQNSATLIVGNAAETAATPIVNRSGQGTLVIAPGAGTAATNLGVNEVVLTNSTTAGNIPALVNGIVNTSIVGQNNDANRSGDFLTYDNTKGFILATYTDTNFATPTNASVELANTAQANLPTTNVFALNTSANITVGAGNTLTVGNNGTGAGQSGQAGLILNGGAISGSTGTLSFGGAEATIYTSGANGTISTAVNNGGGLLTFFGPGTLTVSGNISNAGTTNMQGGTVIFSGDNTNNGGATNVGQNAVLQLQANATNTTGGINNALSQTAAQLQLANNSTLQLRADAPTTFYNNANGISMNSRTVNIDVNQLTAAGTNNTLTLAPAGFSANNSTINVTGGNGYNLSLGTITNPTSGTIDTLNPTTANVTLAGFTASATGGNESLALGGTSTGNSVSGPITNGTGSVTLVKTNTSTWVLNAANTYTGGTTINGGVLSLNNSGALGTTGTITVGGGTLQYTGNNNTDYSARLLIPDGQTAGIDTNGVNVTFASTLLAQTLKAGALNKIGAGTLAITATNSFTGGTTVSGGTLALNITGALVATSNVTNNAGLEIGAPITLNNVSGTGTTTVDATQSLTVNNFTQGGLVNNGTAQVNGTGTVGPISGTGTLSIGTGTSNNTLHLAHSSGANTMSALNIGTGSALDVNNDHVFINYGAGPDPISTIAAMIVSGFAGGAWNGPGINSSAAQTTSLSYGLGYADSADAGNPAGLAPGQIEIKYTLLGDANLDGKVNGTDFAILSTNFNQAVSGWDQGDFNYDFKANGSDFGFIATNFNQGASQAADEAALQAFAAANGLLTSVPEPASMGLLLTAGLGILGRRRRRQ